MDLLKQQQEFLKRQERAIVNAPKPSSSHTAYVSAGNRQTTKRKRTAADSSKFQSDGESSKANAENGANFGTRQPENTQ